MGSSPNWSFDFVPTPAQWNELWASKQDELNLSTATVTALAAGAGNANGIATLDSTGKILPAQLPEIPNDLLSAVPNTALATMAASTIKGNATGAAATPADLTGTQATALLSPFTGDSGAGGVKGLVPAPATGDAAAGKVLGAAGGWVVPAGGGNVTGPASATAGHIATFADTTGKVLADGGALGTAAAQNTGTSGATVPLLNGTNTWSGTQTAAGLLANSTGGLGYTTGAGGTVTQATSKTTAVTLNKLCGKIIMNAAALADQATVSFVLNNTTIGVNDVVVVHLAGGFTAYSLAYASNSGTVTIFVQNLSGASLSDAVQINFAVIKSAIA